MKKYLLSLTLSALCVAGLQAKEHEILMLNKSADGTMTFSPIYLNAQVGDTVKFIAKDKGHDAESFLVPDGAKPFKGKINEEIVYKLEKEGVYLYDCLPHKAMNMTGIIQVGKAVNKDAALKAIDDYEAKTAKTNKGRLKKHAANIK